MAGRSSIRMVSNRTQDVSARVRGAVGGAVRDIGLDLLSQAVVLAPVDEGPLRGSGTAHFNGERIATGRDFDPLAEGDGGLQGGAGTDPTTSVVAFNMVYATAQHEGTDFHHPKGGEAKYLERPLEENRQLYTQAILDAAKKALE